MSYSGMYKGTRFRSILELSVIRQLEKDGLILGETMLYESTTVPYGKTKIRNYVVDLTLPEMKLLIEIKPVSRADNKNNRSKRYGAESWCKENGWEYIIITEEELDACGERLTLEQASKISDVQLNERALRALRRKVALHERKKRKKK
jgi:predicted HTH domain antitoxin